LAGRVAAGVVLVSVGVVVVVVGVVAVVVSVLALLAVLALDEEALLVPALEDALAPAVLLEAPAPDADPPLVDPPAPDPTLAALDAPAVSVELVLAGVEALACAGLDPPTSATIRCWSAALEPAATGPIATPISTPAPSTPAISAAAPRRSGNLSNPVLWPRCSLRARRSCGGATVASSGAGRGASATLSPQFTQ
jgi:hypothetical protein